ncbi:D-threo-aldose 1-dehydrogenase [Microbacterium sp. cf046]|uniref:aldo/keto reductase n=1 Tax=Microbacterium sp. cf046 TaxID=1761803 RepID=UPI0008EC8DFF|nr:aldo/keto reductase [Microbacterium sp. cf046]SFR92901.1 D-threo-aldose 1-dehydrogenase [Microbacterium sp. cf046]
MNTRVLGRTGLRVTELCFGTSPLANFRFLYGYEVDDDRAVATVRAALDSPVRFLDTSNGYGEHGESELRIGAALRKAGGLPADYVLATKVDPRFGSTDFGGARVRESYRESLERLGLDRVPLLHLHDPERIGYEASVAPGGPVEALQELKDSGLVDFIGVAGGSLSVLRPLVETGVFDVVLTHNRYTLLDRSAEELIAAAHDLGIGVLNAAPYGGGMLAKGPAASGRYAYREAGDAQAAALLMQQACERHGVPLAAAALQFSLRDPRIASTVVGVSTPERIEQTIALAAHPIPEELWAELAELTPPRSAWIDV